MIANKGGPAFPQAVRETDGSTTYWHGMTLRDYFAAKAIHPLVVELDDEGNYWHPHHLAELAYDIADAMLKARET